MPRSRCSPTAAPADPTDWPAEAMALPAAPSIVRRDGSRRRNPRQDQRPPAFRRKSPHRISRRRRLGQVKSHRACEFDRASEIFGSVFSQRQLDVSVAGFAAVLLDSAVNPTFSLEFKLQAHRERSHKMKSSRPLIFAIVLASPSSTSPPTATDTSIRRVGSAIRSTSRSPRPPAATRSTPKSRTTSPSTARTSDPSSTSRRAS